MEQTRTTAGDPEPETENSTELFLPKNILKSFNLVALLPPELQLLVIEGIFIPKPPCLRHLFDQCPNQWMCESGCHPEKLPHHPDPSFSSMSPLFYEEGHKTFDRHNIFVFNGSPLLYRNSSSMLQELLRAEPSLHGHWRLARDPRTLGFLDFVDCPPSAPGMSDSIRPPQVPRRFAERIKHLVLCVNNNVWIYRETGWEWPLKVNWTTLPHLETLCLDLRSYSRSQLSAVAESQESYYRKLVAGAKRMECLQLKRLILVGLCSGPYYENGTHKHQMKKLFRKSVADGVEIELWDTPHFVQW